ncbi:MULTISPECIES: helix-turn-helix domain-containing protein [unclassified Butyrivibrio]|uniref:helix-turn-helix domain-containing protein n=1 Tax=unclassified Butyrivibrio TaxID=2639466 RepID=UPI0003B3E6C8|nr:MULTISPECIES: helix-turn-helix domain-containing protein [unclassified Butyrivibrio]SDB02612.1 AraC-type DNA-binding protein [Butyrivibrio sp. INlla16]SEL50252.1 AraC-type DNA-binding protein [Butyrivibrio sp. ob235]
MLLSKDWEENELNLSESEMIHRQQNDEYMFYQSVASGDVDAIQENIDNHRFLDANGTGTLSRDPLQNLKYHFVVTVALITRICTEKGMEMERAFRLSDFYIQKLDDIKTINEISDLHSKMVMDYTVRMKDLKHNANLSKTTNECLNYIYTNVNDRITIDDLAEHMKTSTSHISRLFKEELGISPSDYIRNVKLDKAKNLLRFSDYSIIDISNYLSFSSQSHFSKLFFEETGMTPKKYRETYYGTTWK